MSNIFRYQLFVAVSGNMAGEVRVVDNVSSSHKQETYPITSLDRNSIELEFQKENLDFETEVDQGSCLRFYKSNE